MPHRLHAVAPSASLTKLKGLKHLENITLRNLRWRTPKDPLITAWHALDQTPTVERLDRFVEALNEFSPIGLNVDAPGFSLLRGKFLRKGLLGRVLHHFRQAGVRLDYALLSHHQAIGSYNMLFTESKYLRLLIENELDLGSTDSSGGTVLLNTVLSYKLSPEMFQLIFEEKLVKDKTMTAFEYAQSLHPDYPFFWDQSLFHRIICSPVCVSFSIY